MGEPQYPSSRRFAVPIEDEDQAMKRKENFSGVVYTLLLSTIAFVLMPVAAYAYVGPGAGLTAIGTLIALLAAIALAVVGFVWYPVRRMIRKRRTKVVPKTAPENQR